MTRALFPFRYNEIHDKKSEARRFRVPVNQRTWSKQRPFLLSYMIFFHYNLTDASSSFEWAVFEVVNKTTLASGSVYVRVWAHTPVTLWSQCVWVSTPMTLWFQWACMSTPMMLWFQWACVSTPMDALIAIHVCEHTHSTLISMHVGEHTHDTLISICVCEHTHDALLSMCVREHIHDTLISM